MAVLSNWLSSPIYKWDKWDNPLSKHMIGVAGFEASQVQDIPNSTRFQQDFVGRMFQINVPKADLRSNPNRN